MLEFISQHIFLDYGIRLAVSLIFGFCLGFERKIRQHTVGIRTLILITSSSALLSILSVYMAETGTVKGDPTRIAAAVITGIGFLGSGAIFRQGLNIRGLTSAAIIFACAAIGLSCGAGLYIPAAITFVFALVTLVIMGRFEHKLFPAEKRKLVEIKLKGKIFNNEEINKILVSYGLIIHDMDLKYSISEDITTLIYTIKTPDNIDSISMSQNIAELPGFLSFNLSKY